MICPQKFKFVESVFRNGLANHVPRKKKTSHSIEQTDKSSGGQQGQGSDDGLGKNTCVPSLSFPFIYWRETNDRSCRCFFSSKNSTLPPKFSRKPIFLSELQTRAEHLPPFKIIHLTFLVINGFEDGFVFLRRFCLFLICFG